MQVIEITHCVHTITPTQSHGYQITSALSLYMSLSINVGHFPVFFRNFCKFAGCDLQVELKCVRSFSSRDGLACNCQVILTDLFLCDKNTQKHRQKSGGFVYVGEFNRRIVI